MTAWRSFLNDRRPDCGVAACCNAMLLWGTGNPTDEEARLADDRFGALDDFSKPLWGWWRRGIAGVRLGGFARIRPEQVYDAVSRFGCVYLCLSRFNGVMGNHVVLMIGGGVTVSWGKEHFVATPLADIVEAYAIAPDFSPILAWWALTNNPRWLLFLAPLWWPR